MDRSIIEAVGITPFRYSRLVYTLIISVVFFGEHPDAFVLIGAAIITLSGLYIFWRERRLLRLRRSHSATMARETGDAGTIR